MLARIVRAVLTTGILAVALTPVAAADGAYTLEGKTIRIVNHGRPGTGPDLQARIVGEFLVKYLPGSPKIVTQPVLGAGGLKALQFLAQLDPTTDPAIVMVNTTMPFRARAGTVGDLFDPRRFQWIGGYTESAALCLVAEETGIHSAEDLRTRSIRIGGISATGTSNARHMLLMHGLGLKLDPVLGYDSSQTLALALARGEIEGMCATMADFRTILPPVLKDTPITPIVHISLRRRDDIDAPHILDVPMSDEQAEFTRRALSTISTERAFAASPGADPAFVEAMREAFGKMVADREFVAKAETMGEDVRFVDSSEIGRMIDALYAISDEKIHEIGRILTILE